MRSSGPTTPIAWRVSKPRWRRTKIHPDIRAGDALSLLPDVLSQAPQEGTLCVYHSLLLLQFSTQERATLDDLVALIGRRRPIYRLSMEWDGGAYSLVLVRSQDGATDSRVLASCDSHASTMEWRA